MCVCFALFLFLFMILERTKVRNPREGEGGHVDGISRTLNRKEMSELNQECWKRQKIVKGEDCLRFFSLPIYDPVSREINLAARRKASPNPPDAWDKRPRRCKEIVPRVFVTVGKDGEPTDSYFVNSRANPSFSSLYFDDQSAFEFVRERCGSRAAAAYACLIPAAFRADLFRFCFLHSSGGVYADSDHYFIRPIEQIVSMCSEATVGHDSFRYNAEDTQQKHPMNGFQMKILAGVASHPVWKCMIDGIVKHVEDRYMPELDLAFSGPILLHTCVSSHPGTGVVATYWDTRDGEWPYSGCSNAEGVVSYEKGGKRDFVPTESLVRRMSGEKETRRRAAEDVHYSYLFAHKKVFRKANCSNRQKIGFN